LEDLAAAAAAFEDAFTVPRAVRMYAVFEAIRGAPKASSPGPLGLRSEHPWALSAAGQNSHADVVLLLKILAAVSPMLAVARHALAGADLLLVTKPGGSAPTACHASAPLGFRR